VGPNRCVSFWIFIFTTASSELLAAQSKKNPSFAKKVIDQDIS